MRTRISIWLLTLFILVIGSRARGQQPEKVPTIAYLSSATREARARGVEALVQSLRERGYVEGKNIAFESRYADGKPDRLPELARELVDHKVSLIVADNNTVARAIVLISKTTPVVLANSGDPVGSGLVASLARPGGNITGLSNLTNELGQKRLELLKEIVPGLAKVAVLATPAGPRGRGGTVKEMGPVANALKIQLHIMDLRVADDLEQVFKVAADVRVGALAVNADGSGLFLSNERKIIDLATKYHLPTIFPEARWVNAGGLMSYAASELDNFRRAAIYVEKILNGAKPADLPIEQPTKFEFVINLKAAKQIGLTIPPGVVARADRVIK